MLFVVGKIQKSHSREYIFFFHPVEFFFSSALYEKETELHANAEIHNPPIFRSVLNLIRLLSHGEHQLPESSRLPAPTALMEEVQVQKSADYEGPEIATTSHQQMLIKRAEIRIEVNDLQKATRSLKST